jgi:curved DNA-binding protein CbpA
MSIDFNTLKYNLYTILNVPNDADNVTIKTKFMKIIKNFHPDKNTELEEEIYYHIILANQVLLNKELRKKYDLFLDPNINTFIDLKESFNKMNKDMNKDINNTSKNSGSKDSKLEGSIKEFTDKCELLNKKHNAVLDSTLILDNETIMERLERIKQERNNVKIIKEDIKDDKDFNNKFNNNKIDGKFKDQIIEYTASSDLATYISHNNYTNIEDIDKLYVEDTIQSTDFSSLNRAFLLHPTTLDIDDKKSLDDKMKEYKKQSNIIIKKM